MSDDDYCFEITHSKHGTHTVVAPVRFRAELELRRWYVRKNRDKNCYYVMAGTGGTRAMHRFIWELSGRTPTPQIDHRDGNPLNNSESNLRAATHAENLRNIGIRKNNKSGAIGVSWCKRTKRWEAYVTADWKRYFFGRYVRIEDAIKARDTAVARLHGEFAVLNGHTTSEQAT